MRGRERKAGHGNPSRWAAVVRGLLGEAEFLPHSTEFVIPLTSRRPTNNILQTTRSPFHNGRAKFTGDANRYARESTDALREYLDAERSGLAVGEQLLAEIESYVDKPETADPKKLEELGKQLDVLDSKSKAAFQRAKDAMTRLRTVVL